MCPDLSDAWTRNVLDPDGTLFVLRTRHVLLAVQRRAEEGQRISQRLGLRALIGFKALVLRCQHRLSRSDERGPELAFLVLEALLHDGEVNERLHGGGEAIAVVDA